MEKHIQTFLNKLSYTSITIATITLLILYLQTPTTCIDPSNPNPNSKFPTSTCDFSHRQTLTLETHIRKIQSTKSWSSAVSSFSTFFQSFQIQNHSRILIVSAGPGQPVIALHDMGVEDVTGVEIVESRPLVSRGDVNKLPYFDGAFDFGFGFYLDRALFPGRYVGEIERTVRGGGVCVVCVEEVGVEGVESVVKLFRVSRFGSSENVVLGGEKRTRIVMVRNND